MLVHLNGRTYAYRSIRDGSKVGREYLGSGLVAVAIGRDEAVARERREAGRALRRASDALDRERDRAVIDALRAIDRTVADALESRGFYRHARGPWRRRRGAMTMATTTGGTGLAVAAERHRGDLAALAERLWVKAHAGEESGLMDAIRDKAEAIRAELLGPDPSPIERMIVDKAVMAYLDASYREIAVSQHKGDAGSFDALDRRRVRSDRRYLAALKTLAQDRRLQVPAIVFNGPARVAVR